MRFHKTYKSCRTTYTYEFGDGTDFTLRPGEKGVTEFDIKLLHRLDDREVENNIASCKPPRTDNEKEEIKSWKKSYKQSFKEKYGYIPCNADIDFAVQEKYPKNWNISIDWEMELYGDKSTIIATEQLSDDENTRNDIKDRIDFLLRNISSRDLEIYRRVLLNKEKKISVAKDFGISDVYVGRIAKRIESILSSDEILQKFFHFSSDLGKKDRLETQGGCK